MDSGPKTIFLSKDAAKGRKVADSFFVGRIPYYMVTSATLFCESEAKKKKLMGGTSVYKWVTNRAQKTFFSGQGTLRPLETSAVLL